VEFNQNDIFEQNPDVGFEQNSEESEKNNNNNNNNNPEKPKKS
jgi:hypothetical protein